MENGFCVFITSKYIHFFFNCFEIMSYQLKLADVLNINVFKITWKQVFLGDKICNSQLQEVGHQALIWSIWLKRNSITFKKENPSLSSLSTTNFQMEMRIELVSNIERLKSSLKISKNMLRVLTKQARDYIKISLDIINLMKIKGFMIEPQADDYKSFLLKVGYVNGKEANSSQTAHTGTSA